MEQLRTMAGELPGIASEICRANDLAGIADATLARFQERCDQWCDEVVTNNRLRPARAFSPSHPAMSDRAGS